MKKNKPHKIFFKTVTLKIGVLHIFSISQEYFRVKKHIYRKLNNILNTIKIVFPVTNCLTKNNILV